MLTSMGKSGAELNYNYMLPKFLRIDFWHLHSSSRRCT